MSEPSAPPPLVSPSPPSNIDDGTISGVRRRVNSLQAREQARTAEAKAAATLAASKRVKNFIWATVGVVIATIIMTVSTLGFAQNAIDGGATKAAQKVFITTNKRIDIEAARVTFMERDMALVKAELAENRRANDIQNRVVIRSEAILEMLANNRGIPLPPKLLPDGGP